MYIVAIQIFYGAAMAVRGAKVALRHTCVFLRMRRLEQHMHAEIVRGVRVQEVGGTKTGGSETGRSLKPGDH